MSGITTHVLDTARGRPASGIAILLEIKRESGWTEVGHALTDADGRARQILPAGSALITGVYRLTFELETYFKEEGIEGFYPIASVVFHVRDANQHYHVPILLSPFGYSTYRGS
jgi:5-hydroxyisourate hydrolase